MKREISVKTIHHLISQQSEAEQAYLREFRCLRPSLENPYVRLNPYLIMPLTAVVAFYTEEESEVTMTVNGMETEGNITVTFPKAIEHVLPVLGLYPGHSNIVELSLPDGRKQCVTIVTAPMDSAVKLPETINTTAEYMNGQMMFVVPAMGALPSAYDYRGDCRWYCTENLTFAIRDLQNGRFCIGSPRLMERPYYTTGLLEMDLVGKVYAEYRLPGGYHHDQFEMEDGNLLILTECFEKGTVEDMCVLVDRDSGRILKTWDFKDILPQGAAPSGSWSAHDWFHNNALWYDKNTDSITLSGRHQDVLVNIDFQTGSLNWMIGDPQGWPQDLVDAYFLKPMGELEWQYEQHACIITPDGDVMTFDNGHYRSKSPERYRLGKDNYSRGVRFRMDLQNRTVEQVWQYGKTRGSEFFSPYISNVDYYGENHYLVHSGGIASLDGITCEGVGSRRYFENKSIRLESKTVEIHQGQVVYEMCLNANYYRAKKRPLYKTGSNLSLETGKLLGSLGITPEFGTVAETTYESDDIPDKYQISVSEEIDRYMFHGIFEKGQLVMLVLDGGTDNRHSYYISTAAQSFTAMCVGTFQSPERQVDFRLNKCGLNGTYKVGLIIDETKYDLDFVLTVNDSLL